MFGRGGEEVEYLGRHGIPFEVVPGITAAIACAAYAGIPLTDRDHAEHCTSSPRTADAADRVDWQRLAGRRQTLAIYMGVAAAARVRDRLLAAGMPPSTPAALIENGTLPASACCLTDLAALDSAVVAHAIARHQCSSSARSRRMPPSSPGSARHRSWTHPENRLTGAGFPMRRASRYRGRAS